MLSEFDVTVLQLVEMGLCSFKDVKDGSLNFRDLMKLAEYAKLKHSYSAWKQQRDEADIKARKLWQK